jgi:hypothetical protein
MSERIQTLLLILAIALVFYLALRELRTESERWSKTLVRIARTIPAAVKQLIIEPLTGRPLALVDFFLVVTFAGLCYKSLDLLLRPAGATEKGYLATGLQPYVTPALPVVFLTATVIVAIVSLRLVKEE